MRPPFPPVARIGKDEVTRKGKKGPDIPDIVMEFTSLGFLKWATQSRLDDGTDQRRLTQYSKLVPFLGDQGDVLVGVAVGSHFDGGGDIFW